MLLGRSEAGRAAEGVGRVTFYWGLAGVVAEGLRGHNYCMSESYRWLKDVTRSDERVLSEIARENRVCDTWFEPLEIKRKALAAEMVERESVDFESVHVKDGGYDYFYREGSQDGLRSHWRKSRENGEVELLLDENKLSGGGYLSVGDLVVSDNGEYVAYTLDYAGDEEYALQVRRISDGVIIAEVEGVADDGICFVEGDRGVVFLRRDASFRTYQVWGKLFNGEEFLIIEDKDEGYYLSSRVSRDKRFIVVESVNVDSSGVMLIERGNARVVHNVVGKRKGELVSLDSYAGKIIGITDFNRRDKRLVEITGDEDRCNWRDLCALSEGVTLEDFEIFDGFIAIEARVNGFSRVGYVVAGEVNVRWLSDLSSGESDHLGDNPEPGSKVFRFVRDYWCRPSEYLISTVDKSGELSVGAVELVEELNGFDSDAYTSEVRWFDSNGTNVPLSIIYRKGIVFGDVMVTGYSSYGESFDPELRNSWISLLDRNVAIAVIHGRGGGEYGRDWHDSGKLDKRMNTFFDFVNGIEYLISEGFAKIGRVVISGGSAGGTVVGAVTNLRPDLLCGVVAEVPFVDCLSTMFDSELPLTTGEYEEWGNPNDPFYEKVIAEYSPVDNVVAANYPDIFCVTALNDTRVGYWEGMIWVNRVREFSTRNGSYLVRVHEAGHAGSADRWKRLDEESEWVVFTLQCLK
ncbi:MAG: prolyl oligopeptidase family serine peptidase [Candidatus Paceibacterota bacterium]